MLLTPEILVDFLPTSPKHVNTFVYPRGPCHWMRGRLHVVPPANLEFNNGKLPFAEQADSLALVEHVFRLHDRKGCKTKDGEQLTADTGQSITND